MFRPGRKRPIDGELKVQGELRVRDSPFHPQEP